MQQLSPDSGAPEGGWLYLMAGVKELYLAQCKLILR